MAGKEPGSKENESTGLIPSPKLSPYLPNPRRMKSAITKTLGCAAALALLPLALSAQSNSIPGTDVSLGQLGSMKYWGRTGAFPNGSNGFSMSTTSCNLGTVNVPWQAPMASNHPTISFLLVRANADRMVQVSDYSYVKHGFFALSNSQCTPCQNPSGGTFLGVGCSDTYDVNNNGDNFWLAPAGEIDPWLNTWVPNCSHFDRGEPAVSPPQDCDGVRSLTSGQAGALGPVAHRMQVNDSDLNVTGYTFWYQSQYNIRGEPEANRNNNVGSRQANFTWTGSAWNPVVSGTLLAGSVLQRWSGASVTSATNGGDDGRLYVGVKVTPVGPNFHYEYALHNRDNKRGVGAFRIPIAPGTVITGAGFRDIDASLANDWTYTISPTQITVSTGSNPLRWNSIFNFWFDANTGPGPAVVALDQFSAGGGAPTVGVPSTVPSNAGCPGASNYCTSKVSSSGCTPTITAAGAPSLSAAGSFVVTSNNLEVAKNGIQFFGTTGPDSLPFQDGTLCVLQPLHRLDVKASGGVAACSGAMSYTLTEVLASPSGGALVVAGQAVHQQGWFRDPAAASQTGLTNGVTYTVCP